MEDTRNHKYKLLVMFRFRGEKWTGEIWPGEGVIHFGAVFLTAGQLPVR